MDISDQYGETLSDDRVQAALDWLLASSDAAAKARAERLYLDDYSKHLKARLMTEAKVADPKLPIGLLEAQALASDDYLAHLSALRYAIEIDERLRWKRDASQAVLAAFQTFSANHRADQIR